MDQQTLMEQVSAKLKLIRVERGYTQDRMASILGISKKTLVQIEKGRTVANWTTTLAVCALFRNSEVLRNIVGGDSLEMIEILAHHQVEEPKAQTMGGKVWWKTLNEQKNFILQQNIVSQHYRIIDNTQKRWYSCADQREAELKLYELEDTLL